MAGSETAKSEGSNLDQLQTSLAYRFERLSLLELALTHRSAVYDGALNSASVNDLAGTDLDNEQMEFLGDALIGFLVADSLCRRFPAYREGELTRTRASVVSRKNLGEVGRRLDLGRWLRVGRTVEQIGGRANASLLSNAAEALIAAIYLDGGLQAARQFVERKIIDPALPALERSLALGGTFSGAVEDYKSALQEYLQAQGRGQPEYRLVEESGPSHKLLFRVSVLAAGTVWGEGLGPNKKEAQRQAARAALSAMKAADPIERLGK